MTAFKIAHEYGMEINILWEYDFSEAALAAVLLPVKGPRPN